MWSWDHGCVVGCVVGYGLGGSSALGMWYSGLVVLALCLLGELSVIPSLHGRERSWVICQEDISNCG